MNAQELLKKLKEFPHRSFRVVVHSYSVDGVAPDLEGVDAFLHRPVSKEELVETVRKHMPVSQTVRQRVLLVAKEGFEATRLNQFLSGTGHSISRVDSLESATAHLKTHADNVVLISIDVLDQRWSDLNVMTSVVEELPLVIVLSPTLNKRDQRLAEQYGVRLEVYEPGREATLIPSLLAKATTSTMEYSS